VPAVVQLFSVYAGFAEFTTTVIVTLSLFPPVFVTVQVTVCVPTAKVLVLVYAVEPILYVVV